MNFDPWNHSLKIHDSIGIPTSKVGVHLGVVGSFPNTLTHTPKNENVIHGLHSWPAPFHAFALVASPRLRSWQILQHMRKEKKQMCQNSYSMGFSLDYKTWKLMSLMWREVSYVVGF
jgi:hypothetical protein